MSAFSQGDVVSFSIGGQQKTGTYITERDGMAVLKMDNGYNIGIATENCSLLDRYDSPPIQSSKEVVEQDPSLPHLSIVSTGGTIASRIDYRTGAVTSQFDAADILRAIPGLRDIARYSTRRYQRFSRRI